MENKDAIDVVAALVEENGKFLVGQRGEGKSQGGLWEFVGGKIEPGETPEAALARECKEELDLDVECGETVDSLVHRYPGKTIRLILIECRRKPFSNAKAKEHKSVAWKSIEEMRALDFAPADKILFARRFGNAPQQK